MTDVKRKQWHYDISDSRSKSPNFGASLFVSYDPKTGVPEIDKEDWEKLRVNLAHQMRHNCLPGDYLYIVFEDEFTKSRGMLETLFGVRRG